jgi:hypothetical protein
MVMNSVALGLENDCAGENHQQSLTTDPLSPQGGHHTSTNPKLFHNNKNLVLGSKWVLDTKRG